jgi:hypothetical protein
MCDQLNSVTMKLLLFAAAYPAVTVNDRNITLAVGLLQNYRPVTSLHFVAASVRNTAC